MPSEPVSERAKRLWESLHDVFSNEDGWRIVQDALDEERNEAQRLDFIDFTTGAEGSEAP